MSNKTFEIRVCESCGLRYPLVQGNPHGTRCPLCMGLTRVALTREIEGDFHREEAKVAKEPNLGDKKLFDIPRASIVRSSNNFSILLDNIRSAWNVGSILRSADGFGILHAYLCGITPTPENEAVQKTSLGAEDSVTWSHHKDAVKLVRGLKAEGWRVLALEDDLRAVKITSAPRSPSSREVLILGNEVTGVDPDLLALSDEIYYLPMRGEKKSLNVAIAFSVAAFALQK
ncbi:MAG TPA: RNA methyltransferase [Anaerolineales bacterium]|nr:RNA methyltransferase [Anaerolineales bacterium]